MEYIFPAILVVGFLAYVVVLAAAMLFNCCFGWRSRRSEVSSGQSVDESSEIVITLVHGTWARRSQWISPESTFSQALCSSLAPNIVTTKEFRWSGRNSVSARHQASADLALQLEHSLELWPDARHFIIGHSHGGTVAFKALADSRLQARIDGVITLSTPFILHQLRSQNIFLSICLTVVPLLLCWLVLPTILLLAFPMLDNVRDPLIVLGFAAGIFALVYAPRHYERLATTLATRLSLPRIASEKVFILRGTMDEALLGLSAAQAISFAINSIYAVPAAVLEQAIERASIWGQQLRRHGLLLSFVFLAGWFLSLAATLMIIRESEPYFRIASGVFTCTTLVGILYLSLVSANGGVAFVIGGLIIGVCTLPLLILLALLAVPLGYELAFAAILLQVSAEATPTGTWTVWHWHSDISLSPHERLSHSALYDDMSALSEISSFIVSRCLGNAT